jgi:hypothetical protein
MGLDRGRCRNATIANLMNERTPARAQAAARRPPLAREIVTGGRDGNAGSGSGDKPRVELDQPSPDAPRGVFRHGPTRNPSYTEGCVDEVCSTRTIQQRPAGEVQTARLWLTKVASGGNPCITPFVLLSYRV